MGVSDEVDRHGLIALLNHEDGPRYVAGLGLLRLWEVLDFGINQENVGEIVDLVLVDLGDLVHVSVDPDVPSVVGPVRVRSA